MAMPKVRRPRPVDVHVGSRVRSRRKMLGISQVMLLHAQQIVAKLDRLIENVAKSSGLLRLVPTQAPIGPSAVIRPVPGGEHKGMLKLVDFTQPANGAVSRNADQSLTFRPKPGFTGKDSFDYTLRDEAGTMFSATVTVAITLEATGHSDPTTPPHVVEPDTA